MEKISLYNDRRFVFKYKNGLKISIAVGEGSWSTRTKVDKDHISAANAEIAIMTSVGGRLIQKVEPWLSFGTDVVHGYTSPSQITEIMHIVKNAKDMADAEAKVQAYIKANDDE